jgi:hypothetical protein
VLRRFVELTVVSGHFAKSDQCRFTHKSGHSTEALIYALNECRIFIRCSEAIHAPRDRPSLQQVVGANRGRFSTRPRLKTLFGENGEQRTVHLTTNLFRSVIHDADLNTNCSFRSCLNKANELSPGVYRFFPQERYTFPKI